MQGKLPVLALTVLAALASSSCGRDAAPTPIFTELTSPNWSAPERASTVADSFYMPLSLSGGVGWLDADSDGDLDIVAIDPTGLPPRLFLNDDGTFRAAGEAFPPIAFGMGVAIADYDRDGDPDILVTTTAANALFRNDGGAFTDVTAPAGLAEVEEWSASAMWLDYDRDGWLDLFVTNYLASDQGVDCSDPAGRREFCGPTAYPPMADRLWRNRGDGSFEDVSVATGIAGTPGRGLGVVALDVDGDARDEVFVANDGEPNFLWQWRDDSGFVDVASRSGVAVNGVGRSEAGMGVGVGDADGDGALDLFLTHLGGESHTLYRRVEAGLFADETTRGGLQGATLPHTGFGTGFADVDNDGDLDLLVANGRINRDIPVEGAGDGFTGPYAEANRLYLNDGSGTFNDAGALAGDFGLRPGMSRGLAVADYDDDGRLDVAVVEVGGPLRLFRNTAVGGEWIGFRLLDPETGVNDPVGSHVTLFVGDDRLVRTVVPSSTYLSSHDPRVHFGLGNGSRPDSVAVRWPRGNREVFRISTGSTYVELRRGEGS